MSGLVSRLDLRPGGVFHYSMRSPAGHVMWGRFVYRDIGGSTTVTLRGGPINSTEQERETFWNGQDSLQQGFAATCDHLAAYLAVKMA